MDISISCFNFRGLGYDKALPRLKQIGYGALDIPIFQTGSGFPEPYFNEPERVWKKTYAELAKKISDNGLKVGQTHGHYHGSAIDECRYDDALFELLEKEMTAAAILGSPYIVVHPLRLAKDEERKQADFELNVNFYSKLIEASKRTGVKVAIENMFKSYDGKPHVTGCSFSADLARYIDALNSDRFVACLDTGHANIVGEDVATAVRTLGKRLKLLHVNDNFGNSDQHSLPGFGSVNWKDFIEALKEVGYTGTYNYETESFGRLTVFDEEIGFDYAEYAYKLARRMLGSEF